MRMGWPAPLSCPTPPLTVPLARGPHQLHPWEGWPSGGAGLGLWPRVLLAQCRAAVGPFISDGTKPGGDRVARLTLGRQGRGSPLVWPLNWGPTVTYTWNTGCSWMTSSSPKLVAIWRWVDVCLKTVMLPGGNRGSADGLLGGPGHRGARHQAGAVDIPVLYGSHLTSPLLVITSS